MRAASTLTVTTMRGFGNVDSSNDSGAHPTPFRARLTRFDKAYLLTTPKESQA